MSVGIAGAWLTIVGILVSGPIGLALVNIYAPIGVWSGATALAETYSWIQTVPYFGGMLLVFGYVTLLSALYVLADAEVKAHAMAAIVCTSAFAALIFLNYTIQVSYVPSLLIHYDRTFDNVISMLSMANPTSLAWTIEMWGYALLGGATWFAAIVFGRTPLERRLAFLMRLNGLASLAGGVLTAIDPGWVQKRSGLAAYACWNALMLGLSILVIVVLRRRVQARRATQVSV